MYCKVDNTGTDGSFLDIVNCCKFTKVKNCVVIYVHFSRKQTASRTFKKKAVISPSGTYIYDCQLLGWTEFGDKVWSCIHDHLYETTLRCSLNMFSGCLSLHPFTTLAKSAQPSQVVNSALWPRYIFVSLNLNTHSAIDSQVHSLSVFMLFLDTWAQYCTQAMWVM